MMDAKALWQRYQEWLYYHEGLAGMVSFCLFK
ncbi:glucose-6-phosphate isomerase [Sphaerospermopsis reniformis]|uniref:Glucose-6-phosphate isomerase n=1 Tax=Sphaerospermopsis reniformis TaxID=531300 RepID=A0A480A7B7_9CYAN|nr:glucose-6-phosphate isomerase [Sphaerospermopsis reniformis]